MSTTTASETGRTTPGKDATQQVPTQPGESLAPPPKLRRRPTLIAASVAAICLGALASVWAYTSISDTQEVLGMRQTVPRGEVITREDLMTVQIGVDPALQPLAGTEIDAVIGQRAAMDMAAGGVVTPEQVTSVPLPADGESVVGISLSAGMLPAEQLRVGDAVRVVTTPGQQGEITAEQPDAIAAVVVGTAQDGATGTTIVNVQVPHADAPGLAAHAATGKVAVVLDSRER